MAELCADQAAEGFDEGAWADPSRRKAAAHEARSAQTSAVTSAPTADMVKAIFSGGRIPVEVVVLALPSLAESDGVVP
jgi:hypothetical protein